VPQGYSIVSACCLSVAQTHFDLLPDTCACLPACSQLDRLIDFLIQLQHVRMCSTISGPATETALQAWMSEGTSDCCSLCYLLPHMQVHMISEALSHTSLTALTLAGAHISDPSFWAALTAAVSRMPALQSMCLLDVSVRGWGLVTGSKSACVCDAGPCEAMCDVAGTPAPVQSSRMYYDIANKAYHEGLSLHPALDAVMHAANLFM
jgi:hypothetical protein